MSVMAQIAFDEEKTEMQRPIFRANRTATLKTPRKYHDSSGGMTGRNHIRPAWIAQDALPVSHPTGDPVHRR
jgi:hypothetical protein